MILESKILISRDAVDVQTVAPDELMRCVHMTDAGLLAMDFSEGNADAVSLGGMPFGDFLGQMTSFDFRRREMAYQCAIRNYCGMIAEYSGDLRRDLIRELDVEIEHCFNNGFHRLEGFSNSLLKFNWRRIKDDVIFQSSAESVARCGINWEPMRIYSFRGRYYMYNTAVGTLASDGFGSVGIEFILEEECMGYLKGTRFSLVEQIVRNGIEYCRLKDPDGNSTTIRSGRGRFLTRIAS